MRNINLNYNKIKGKHNKYFSLCVGAGRAGEVLRKDFQDQLDVVKEACKFKYLRFHGIFHDEMGVYKENSDGSANYNWQYVDVVYDSLIDKGIKPFVELSFMPKALASGGQTVFWWNANITPPKDYDKWYSLVNNFLIHLEERYGREEVLTWYFEVWNEPNHPGFFSPTKQFNDLENIDEYFKLYEVTVRAVKDVCREYRVGGPATAGNGWIKEMINYCAEKEVPIDFVSTHTYGIETISGNGEDLLYLGRNKNFIVDDVKRICEQVRTSSKPNLEIHYSEWNTSWYNKDYIHETYIQAPCILYNLKNLEGTVDSMCYWTFTDIFEESGPPETPFGGSFGLINLQGIKKPAFYSYKFLAELGEVELENNDADSWACMDDTGIQLLLWDYTKPLQDCCDEIYFAKDLPSNKGECVHIGIDGIPEGKYKVQVFRVGYSCNDVYTEYIKMGSPKYLSKCQVEELKLKASGQPVFEEECYIEKNKSFEKELQMKENDVYFIKLIR
ncbi:GH39 family glycosyl hydrolase [Clostridium folliculivorans]|uniref:GH39 family glycosyl hydrolase n=1 Tax=Clostridium folliculivorans TaxID=2886038 RepID=UPI0021C2AE56|nr:hypothetical protein [Clostridium folliculivorans]GKU30467.1 beta-xylosidase [Clostridium folliculivorans]